MDDDEDDLWGDFNDDEVSSSVMMSANLCEVAGVAEKKVHEGESDEGKVTWEAPTFSGLNNSQAVGAGTHWYNAPTPGQTPTTAAALATPGKPGAIDWSTMGVGGINLAKGANGQVDWSAMSATAAQPAAQK